MPFNLTLRLSYLEKAFYLIPKAHPLRLQTRQKSQVLFTHASDWLAKDRFFRTPIFCSINLLEQFTELREHFWFI